MRISAQEEMKMMELMESLRQYKDCHPSFLAHVDPIVSSLHPLSVRYSTDVATSLRAPLHP